MALSTIGRQKSWRTGKESKEMLERVQSEKLRKVTFYLDNELAKAIKRVANDRDITQSKYISDLVSADLGTETHRCVDARTGEVSVSLSRMRVLE